MQLSMSTDLAIRILQYLHVNKGLSSGAEISAAIGTTYPFFMKVVSQLKKHKLVTPEQGRNGGYRLGKSAESITIYDIYCIIEGEMAIIHYLSGDQASNYEAGQCAIQDHFRSLQTSLIQQMSRQTIAGLAVSPPQLKGA